MNSLFSNSIMYHRNSIIKNNNDDDNNNNNNNNNKDYSEISKMAKISSFKSFRIYQDLLLFYKVSNNRVNSRELLYKINIPVPGRHLRYNINTRPVS